ncbi:MAG: hypothetical protein ACLR78_05015 [Roseburia sp.]
MMHKAEEKGTSRLSYDLTEGEMHGKEEKGDYLQRNDNRGSIGRLTKALVKIHYQRASDEEMRGITKDETA